MIEKKCSKCNETKLIHEFNRRGKNKDGSIKYRGVCKVCVRQKWKLHYIKKQSYYKDKAKKRNNNINIKRRVEIQDFKYRQGCYICGETDPRCLDFHHTHNNKLNNVGTLISRGTDNEIWNEINKCKIICSNCHRKLHYKLYIDLSEKQLEKAKFATAQG